MQDKILLGLLLEKDLSSYDAKKTMDSSTNFFYSTSFGSINPAFKKLEKEKLVISKEDIKNGRTRKIYKITSKGKKVFDEWMNTDIAIPKIKMEMLLRMFFMDHISLEKRIKILSKFSNKVKEHLAKIKTVKANTGKMKIHNTAIDTIDFGIAHHEFLIAWISKYIEKISKYK